MPLQDRRWFAPNGDLWEIKNGDISRTPASELDRVKRKEPVTAEEAAKLWMEARGTRVKREVGEARYSEDELRPWFGISKLKKQQRYWVDGYYRGKRLRGWRTRKVLEEMHPEFRGV